MPERPVPEVRPDALIAELRRAGGKPVSLPELLQRMHVHPKARRAASKVMKRLVRDGAVQEVDGRFAIPAARAAAKPASPAREGRDARDGRGRRDERGGRERGLEPAQAGKGLL